VQSGVAVRNALFLQPRASYQIIDGLSAEAKVLWARTAALPERLGDRGSYGWEIDAGVRWDGTKHLDLVGTAGVFLPGSYYSNYTPDGATVFTRPVIAAQVLGRVRF
jgi:hypothetical protein